MHSPQCSLPKAPGNQPWQRGPFSAAWQHKGMVRKPTAWLTLSPLPCCTRSLWHNHAWWPLATGTACQQLALASRLIAIVGIYGS